MRITESKLRSIVRKVINESIHKDAISDLFFLKDEARKMLESLYPDGGDDVDSTTAFDLATSMKYSFPHEWKGALGHDIFVGSRSPERDLIRILAEMFV